MSVRAFARRSSASGSASTGNFREALKRVGFGLNGEVDSTEELTGDGYWHHYAFTETAADPATCERLDWLAEATANAHGVRYDGWRVARKLDGTLSDMRHLRTPRPPE